MNPNTEVLKMWIENVTVQLPGFNELAKRAATDTLVIGAGVFEIYQELDWIPHFKRKTGDLDLSVGLVSGAEDYTPFKQMLLDLKYRNDDPDHRYRYFSPKVIPGALAYIDLLAHPGGKSVTGHQAIQAMGAGAEFSFEGFAFAARYSFKILPHIHFPNPFGMWALKQVSYQDDPLRRIKDLADIIELGSGLVEKGMHFEMEPLWLALRDQPEALAVKKMISELSSGESIRWDIDDARQELLSRNFTSEDLDETLRARLGEFVEMMK